MNVFTAALLLIMAGGSVLHAIFAPRPWPGLFFLAFVLAFWAIAASDARRDRRHFLPRTARMARRSFARRLFDAPRSRW